MQQAESDFRAARLVDNDFDAQTRCQAIAKYQQCVEKSVKGVLDKLHDIGVTNAHSDSGHHVARYVSVFTNLPRTRQTSDLLNQLARLFTHTLLQRIDLLDSFVPQYPKGGTFAARNHEYPFQRTAADWRAPSDENAFTTGEMRRIRHCAGILIVGLRRIFDALELLYP
jgi:hypothetical protein